MSICYEGIILFGVTFFFAYGFSAITQFKGEPSSLRDTMQWFMVMVYAVYFGWFWSKGRRTLPMKTLQVRLVKTDGSIVEPWRALWRFFVAGAMYVAIFALLKIAAIAIVLFVVPLTVCLFDSQRRSLYDILAGTRLVVDQRALP